MRSSGYQVLLVDDDQKLGELLVRYLRRFGHELRLAASVEQGRREIERQRPDLVLLDLMLPDASGFDLCHELRRQSQLPIMMLTARGEVSDRVRGLEAGADDYLAKPFEPRELVARIDSVMRRVPARTESEGLREGDLLLEPESRRAELGGRLLDLTTAEFDLLHRLMRSGGRVLTREVLLEQMPRGEEVLDRAVDMTISRLRAKLGDDAQAPRWVRTVRGVGYQFLGDGPS